MTLTVDAILGFISTIIVVTIILRIVKSNKEKLEKYNNGEMSKEEKEKFELQIKKKEEQKQKHIKNKELRHKKKLIKIQNRNNSKTIVKTKIVGTNGKIVTDNNDSLIGGIIGDAMFGPVGAIVGATSGDKKIINSSIFLIEYADGHRVTKTVKNDSLEFKKLCKYLEM